MWKAITKGKREQRLVSAARQRTFMKVSLALLCLIFLLSIIAVPAMAFDPSKDPFERGQELKENINEGEGGQSGDPTGGQSGDPENNMTGWAAEGKETLHKSIGWLCGWVAKLGLLVAFYGVIKFGLSFVQEDNNAKVVGLTAMVSGLMVWSLAMSVNKFFY